MERGQDRRLMPMILEVMRVANVSFDALDRIAVTRGPGSFTGLRIGLAAARGIGLAAEKPVLGIDRFAIFYDQAGAGSHPLLIVINSKRAELFCRFYPIDGVAMDPVMMTKEEIAAFLSDKGEVCITGDLCLMTQHPFHRATEPEAVTCARLAGNANPALTDYLPRPMYLRAPDVTLKPVKDRPHES